MIARYRTLTDFLPVYRTVRLTGNPELSRSRIEVSVLPTLKAGQTEKGRGRYAFPPLLLKPGQVSELVYIRPSVSPKLLHRPTRPLAAVPSFFGPQLH